MRSTGCTASAEASRVGGPPLAILAYAMASLLHRLSEDDSAAREVLSDLLHATPPPLQVTQALQVNVTAPEHTAPPALSDDAAVTVPALSDDTAALSAMPRLTQNEPTVVQNDPAGGALALSKTARVHQLAREHGVSLTTAWRKVRAGEYQL